MTPLNRTSNSEAADCGGEETVRGDKDAVVAVMEDENAEEANAEEDEGYLPDGVGCNDCGMGGDSDRPLTYEGGENRGGERVKYEGRE